MKRYRVFPFYDFDTRVLTLTDNGVGEPDEANRRHQEAEREKTILGLKQEFGEWRAHEKIGNFVEVGVKPFSVIAFHNHFFAQVRTAFVMEAYYPALTGACALGERILNHLILALREDYSCRPEYKRVHGKKSFDNWSIPIDALCAWGVLSKDVKREFLALEKLRQKSIHFRPETERRSRKMALEAISHLGAIIEQQFGGVGGLPWLLGTIPGEYYIKKAWESHPFVRRVYIDNAYNAAQVSYRHRITKIGIPLTISDPDAEKILPEVSDEEFARLRKEDLLQP